MDSKSNNDDQNSVATPLALIVEDDANIAKIIEIVLKQTKFKTEIVSDGQLALDRLAKTAPDLVVTDLHMPRVSGETVLAHLRSQEQFSQTRVILTSADILLLEKLKPMADGILIKPFNISQLSDLVSRLR